MRLAEEMILLLLNEESGYLEHVGGWNMACAVAGSVLADLSLELRVDTDLESLTLIDATETGDELLDPVLAQVAAHGLLAQDERTGLPPLRRREHRWLPVAIALWLCSTVVLAEHYTVPLFVPASTPGGPQGVLRILNGGDASGTVTVYGIDDAGTRSGPATFTLNSRAASEFDAADLANGNAGKGLTGSLGTGTGEWRLEIDTELPIELLAYVRAPDGTLSVMHDTVRGTEVAGRSTYQVLIFNPSTEVTQSSRLRLINPDGAMATVMISGRDDTGAAASGGEVRLTIPANGARTLTAQQLEAGDASLTGRLGAAVGRWRLSVSADRPIRVVNVAVTPAGAWNNLSTTAVRGPAPADHPSFNERFDGLNMVYETDSGRFTLSPQAGERFTEAGEADGMIVSRAGTYGYSHIGPDAGRLTLDYDDGNACAANFYFASRTGGWFASHCTGADHPNGTWLGGTWYADDGVDSSPSFADEGPGGQSYRTGTAIDAVTLPAAAGGDGVLSYSLSPDVPGLSFDGVTRELSGTPTQAGSYAMTYTVTDGDGDTATLSFTLTVVSSDAVAEGDCYVGLIVRIGESCTYPGTEDEFSVNVRGRGRFLDRLAGIRIRIVNEIIGGRVYDFEATHRGDGVWRIDRIANSTEQPSAEDSDGDGIPNVSDPDDDNDGTADVDDHCPLDGANTCDDTSGVASLEVSGATPLTSVGQTIQLTATAHMPDDSSRTVANASVHWVSADPTVATVIDGTVTAVRGGHARIVATYQGQKAVAEISVHISLRETGTVRVLYAAPTDREFRSDYRDAIQHAIVDLQSWFRRQTGGLTFSIYDTTLEQCQLSEASDFYRVNAWQKVLEGVQHCAPVEGETSSFTWVVYADVDTVCNAPGPLRRGGPGLAMLPHEDMEGLIGNRLLYYGVCGAGPWPGPVTLWIGVLGHELGHALRLTEPPGCEERLPTCDREELMHLGATVYPHTYLRPDNKEVLLRSPFVGRNPAHRPLNGDATKPVTIRGTVMDPDRGVVEGIRVSALANAFWGWGQSKSDGMFEIWLPDDAVGSTILSVHAGGVADCGWVGYHVAGGLTTIRQRAIPIEPGSIGAMDIEITLPTVAGELCQGQRTISGKVLGPEGNPAAVWVRAFDRWSSTGDDGLFEIRLPESSEGSGRSSLLFVHSQQCRDFGFYGPGGFTTRPDDATQFEFGAVDVSGIEIRLPATPEEMCGRQVVISGNVVGPDGEVVEGIELEAQPFARRGTSGADGVFEIRLLEGSAGMAVLGVRADCGRVGYYGPNGFTRSRDEATGIEVGEGNVTGIEIRLPSDVNELCGG